MIGVVIAMQSEAKILLDDMKIQRNLTVSGKDVYVGTAYGKEIAIVGFKRNAFKLKDGTYLGEFSMQKFL